MSRMLRIIFTIRKLGHLFSKLMLLLSIAHVCVTAPPPYVIGSVPPQQIAHGGVLMFGLQSPDGGAATFSYTVTPGTRAAGHYQPRQLIGVVHLYSRSVGQVQFGVNLTECGVGTNVGFPNGGSFEPRRRELGFKLLRPTDRRVLQWLA